MTSNRRRFSSILSLASVLAFGCVAALGACTAANEPVDSDDLQGTPEAVDSSEHGIAGEVAQNATLRSTTNVNLRTEPSTSASVIRVVPEGSIVKVVDSNPQNGFYKINHNGSIGWTFGSYYELVSDGGVDGEVAVGTSMVTTTDLNLRGGPATSYSVLDVIPSGSAVKLVEAQPVDGWYRVDFNGTVGWSSGKYLEVGSAESGGTTTARSEAITRAQSAVGFSYWWGHGRFRVEGSTASNRGVCSGSCPSCTHTGSYGGDCSGLAAKVWQVPSSNTSLTTDAHPYSTADFVSDTSQWSTISRDSMKKGDAMVYRSGGAGHIFIYNSGDAWGSMYAYECQGCAAGCIYGSRTAGSKYKAIRKNGW